MGFFNKQSIVKNLKYYLSEIIVVVLGIFIAIQLNNLNEKWKDENREQKALKQIYTDLSHEKLALTYTVNEIRKSKNYLVDVVYKNKTQNLDSIYTHAAREFFHFRYDAEYFNLKNSGNLNLITNDSLRLALTKFYEYTYNMLDYYARDHKNYTSEYIDHYFINYFPNDTTDIIKPALVQEKLEEKEFRNILITQIKWYKDVVDNINTKEIDQLLELTVKEYNKLKDE